jgi:hypothetical protein
MTLLHRAEERRGHALPGVFSLASLAKSFHFTTLL